MELCSPVVTSGWFEPVAEVSDADSGAEPPTEQRMGKVQLTHSHKRFLRSRTRLRIQGDFFVCFGFGGRTSSILPFCGFFLASQSRNVVYRGWTVSSECSQCCWEMVSVSRGKSSGQAADSERGVGGQRCTFKFSF